MSRYRGCLARLRPWATPTAQHTQQSVDRVRRLFVNCLFGCAGRLSMSSFSAARWSPGQVRSDQARPRQVKSALPSEKILSPSPW